MMNLLDDELNFTSLINSIFSSDKNYILDLYENYYIVLRSFYTKVWPTY